MEYSKRIDRDFPPRWKLLKIMRGRGNKLKYEND